MKRFLLSVVMLSVVVASGQAAPSGIPAKLEVANGKTANAFLQSLKDGTLTFQTQQAATSTTAPASKIKSLTFFLKYDAESVEQSFNNADYSDVIATLGSLLEPYWEFMSISNNLQTAFGMLVQSHLENGDFTQVQRAGEILLENSSPRLFLQGQVYTALAALSDTNTFAIAEKLCGEVDSEAAGLYLKACIERAKGNPAAASQIVTDIIADHGNDMDWMPVSELLSAHLYLDAGMTNYAVSAAMQVQHIYMGASRVAQDAAKFNAALNIDVEAARKTENAPKKVTKAAEEEEEQDSSTDTETTEEEEQDSSTEE